MNFLRQLWLSVRSNPIFVSAYSIFFGALATQIQSAHASGHLDWSVAGWEHMASVSALITAWTLAHLYAPAPGATPNGTR